MSDAVGAAGVESTRAECARTMAQSVVPAAREVIRTPRLPQITALPELSAVQKQAEPRAQNSALQGPNQRLGALSSVIPAPTTAPPIDSRSKPENH
jgi:hypothetical protein